MKEQGRKKEKKKKGELRKWVESGEGIMEVGEVEGQSERSCYYRGSQRSACFLGMWE